MEPGVADGVASLTLGLGRRNAGAIGTGIGANAFSDSHLRSSPWVDPGNLEDCEDSAGGRKF